MRKRRRTNSAELEDAAIRAFIRRERRPRALALLRNPSKGSALTGTLAHFDGFDERFLVPIPPRQQTAHHIAQLLTERGAPASCHIMSEWDDFDGRRLPLETALEELVGPSYGSLVICSPRLAYYEGEEMGDRWILARKH